MFYKHGLRPPGVHVDPSTRLYVRREKQRSPLGRNKVEFQVTLEVDPDRRKSYIDSADTSCVSVALDHPAPD